MDTVFGSDSKSDIVSLDVTMSDLREEFQHMMKTFDNAVQLSKLKYMETGIVEEVQANVFAVTITFSNWSRDSKGKYVRKKLPELKRVMLNEINHVCKRLKIKHLLFFELTPYKMRPHYHGLVQGSPENVYDFIRHCENQYGEQCKVKLPFYSPKSTTQWTTYMLKGNKPLDRYYISTESES